MREAKLILGPDAWPWFGPMLILDCETNTGIGQELRFGFFQERGVNYRELIENMRFRNSRQRANIWTRYDRKDCFTIQQHAASMKSKQCDLIALNITFAF